MKASYRTRQKEHVHTYMHEHAHEFLSVDDVFVYLQSQGIAVGRTTVYRTLEEAVSQGTMAKVTNGNNGAAQYRSRIHDEHNQGQLCCIACGSVEPLDCSMLQTFSHHVEETHGFALDQTRSVLYGVCSSCQSENSSTTTLS